MFGVDLSLMHLCNSSLEWAKSLAPYQTWRVIQVCERKACKPSTFSNLSQQERLDNLLPFLTKVAKKSNEGGTDMVDYLEKLNKLWEARTIWQEQDMPKPTSGPKKMELKVEYGNRLRYLGQRFHYHGDRRHHDWYRWTLYVRPSSAENADLLDRIQVQLDRQWFPNTPPITKSGASFQYSTDGWGSIKTTITLTLKKGWKFTGGDSNHNTFEYRLAWPSERDTTWESMVSSQTFPIEES